MRPASPIPLFPPTEDDEDTIVAPRTSDISAALEPSGRWGAGRRWPATLGAVVLLAVALVGTVALRGSSVVGFQVTPQKSRLILTDRVRVDDGRRSLVLTGVVGAARRAELAFTVSGRVSARHVSAGDVVREGEPLLELDSRAFENAVVGAGAQTAAGGAELSQAWAEHRRTRRLAAEAVLSEAQLEGTRARVQGLRASRRAARSRHDEALRTLTEATLRAPFDGTITSVELDEGEFAAPGRAALVITQEHDLEVQVNAPESAVHRLSVGDEVAVRLPLAGRRDLRAHVRSISFAGGGSHFFPVVVALDEEAGVLPGMAAEVAFEMNVDPGHVVPVESVFRSEGEAAVLVVRGGEVVRVRVALDELVRGMASVRGDLTTDDVVVLNFQSSLVAREQVRVRALETQPSLELE